MHVLCSPLRHPQACGHVLAAGHMGLVQAVWLFWGHYTCPMCIDSCLCSAEEVSDAAARCMVRSALAPQVAPLLAGPVRPQRSLQGAPSGQLPSPEDTWSTHKPPWRAMQACSSIYGSLDAQNCAGIKKSLIVHLRPPLPCPWRTLFTPYSTIPQSILHYTTPYCTISF